MLLWVESLRALSTSPRAWPQSPATTLQSALSWRTALFEALSFPSLNPLSECTDCGLIIGHEKNESKWNRLKKRIKKREERKGKRKHKKKTKQDIRWKELCKYRYLVSVQLDLMSQMGTYWQSPSGPWGSSPPARTFEKTCLLVVKGKLQLFIKRAVMYPHHHHRSF